MIQQCFDLFEVSVHSVSSVDGSEIFSLNIMEKQFPKLRKYAEEIETLDIDLSESGKEVFFDHFNVDWDFLLSRGQISNALDTMEYLGVDNNTLLAICTKSSIKRIEKSIYCSHLDINCTKDSNIKSKLQTSIYVINPFFNSMKENYESQDKVHFITFQWDSQKMSWLDFLNTVIGDRDPHLSSPFSIRGRAYKEWEELELADPPTIVHNCVHMSCSAFESLSDRLIWCNDLTIAKDPFGFALLSSHVLSSNMINRWLLNPIVNSKYLFDHMEGLGGNQCIEKAKILSGLNILPIFYILLKIYM
jgi:hypothetical protein